VRGVLLERICIMTIDQNDDNFKPGETKKGPLIISAICYEDPVGKPYGYKKGKVIPGKSERSKMATGKTLSFSSFAEFVAWRKPLPTEYMMTSGTFDNIGEVAVVYKGKEGPGEVSASKSYLAHRDQPGVLIIDIDYKDPKVVAGLHMGGGQPYVTQDAALEALSKVLPEADNCALLIGWSTSSNLYKGKKQVKNTGGIRIYIPVKDASKIPDLIDTMHKRSWLHDEGWAYVGKAGQFEERSLADTALKKVTQPDYAAPDLGDGLTQDREWAEYKGEWLDPALVTPLSAKEEIEYRKAVAEAKEKLASAMSTQKEKWILAQVEKGVKKGADRKRAASAAISKLENGILLPTDTVLFDGGKEVSVLELLTNGEAHNLKTCKDPIEPDYNDGASVGQYYWNNGEGPKIHSYAHGSKIYVLEHDSESAKAAIESRDDNIISLALAQTAYASKTEKLRLEKSAAKALGLGNNVKAFRSDVDDVKKRLQDKDDSKGLDAASLSAIAEGRWPADKPVPTAIFPFKKGGVILSHTENYKTMMAAYGYSCSYDVIKKDVFWAGPQIDMTTDNAFLALFSKMKSLAALNGLPHGSQDLNAHLPAIAEENQVNPVFDYLSALKWDGKDRFGLLVVAMEPHDKKVAKIGLRVWFIGAAAACDHFETGINLVPGARPSFEYVLCLLGAQGVNKTKGFLGLVPKNLSKYAKEGVALNPRNKDSVKIAASYWLVELGELDATFGQAQIADLKAFLSAEADELRLPYAQGYSKFKRRTAFIGTVNQDKFLKDATGNRRYLALECTSGFPTWTAEEVDQLWAQAWALYSDGAQWWPTDDEQLVLDKNAERFRQHSWAETRIRDLYDFSQMREKNNRLKPTELWAEMVKGNRHGDDTRSHHEIKPQQLGELRSAMTKLWSENGAFKRGGDQVIDTSSGVVKTYSDGGRNKGWVVPMTFLEVAEEEKKKQKIAYLKAEKENRIKFIKELLSELRTAAKAEGKKLSGGKLRKQIMAAAEEEHIGKKGSSFPFPKQLWEEAFDEAKELRGGD
jgi:predicted P-loop ATPase